MSTPAQAVQAYCDSITHTHTHTRCMRRRPEKNIPQQQRVGRHEHPEETTLTSCEIKPSRWLFGVITAATGSPLSGWGKAPPQCPLPPTRAHKRHPSGSRVTSLFTSRTASSPGASERMGLLLLLSSALLCSCKAPHLLPSLGSCWGDDWFDSNLVLYFSLLAPRLPVREGGERNGM